LLIKLFRYVDASYKNRNRFGFASNAFVSAQLIDRALGFEPENEIFLTTQGLLDYQSGDYRSAASYLQKVVDAGGATVDRLELLGNSHFALEQKETARAA